MRLIATQNEAAARLPLDFLITLPSRAICTSCEHTMPGPADLLPVEAHLWRNPSVIQPILPCVEPSLRWKYVNEAYKGELLRGLILGFGSVWVAPERSRKPLYLAIPVESHLSLHTNAIRAILSRLG